MAVIVDALERNPTKGLQELCVTENEITGVGCKAVARVVASKRLQILILSENCVGDDGAIALRQVLEQDEQQSLINLVLNRNYIMERGIPAMAQMLCVNQTLQELDVSDNMIDDAAALEMAKALSANRCLKKLNLKHCVIPAQGFAAIGQSLMQNSTLTELCSGCPHGKENVFFDGLQKNIGLRTLHLFGLDDSRVVALAQSLALNSTLTRLNLFWLRIRQQGLDCLATLLSGTTPLRSLELKQLSFEEEVSFATFADALQSNRSLELLHVEKSGPLAVEFLILLCSALKSNCALKSLHLSRVFVNSFGAAQFGGMLMHNKTLSTLILDDTFLLDGPCEIMAALRCNYALLGKVLLGTLVGGEKVEEILERNRNRYDCWRKSVLCWMLVSKRLRISKDIALLVGKRMWETRFENNEEDEE